MNQAARYAGQQELGRGISPVNGLRIDTSQTQQAYGSGYNASATVSNQSNGNHEQGHARSNETSTMDEDSPVEEDVLNEDDQFSDELSSSPSVPDEDIDFEHVYALHTFLATVDGQASVSKGDSLTLLDDSNSYWWLVRVLKTQAVGYIPAENIETPYERLARLNKHRNVDLTGVTQEDRITGPTSTTAVRAIRPPVHVPKSKAHLPPKPRFVAPAGGKSVQFTAPTYFEHSGNEYSDEEGQHSGEGGPFEDGFDDDDDEEEEEGDEHHEEAGEELIEQAHLANSEDSRGRLVGAPKVTPGHGVDDSESGTEDGQGSVDYSHDATITPVNVASAQQSQQAARQVSKGSTQSMQVDDEGMDASDEAEQTDTEESQRRRARAVARGLAIRNAAGQQRTDENTAPSTQQARSQQAPSQRRPSNLSDSPQDNFDPYAADTRKITLTPRIALEGPSAAGSTALDPSQQRSQNPAAQVNGPGSKRRGRT